jgi:hypothetical protein
METLDYPRHERAKDDRAVGGRGRRDTARGRLGDAAIGRKDELGEKICRRDLPITGENLGAPEVLR